MHLSPPPLPREHGAWFMLYTPLLAALAVFRPLALLPSLLLVIALTGAFLSQNALALVLRRRREGVAPWLALYASCSLGATLALVLRHGLVELLWLGAPALALFGRQIRVNRSQRRRFDRSYPGELLAAAVLSLSAPAAYLVARGRLGPPAWELWAACTLYFGGSVFHLKTLVAAARHKVALDKGARSRLGRGLFLYHLALLGLLAALPVLSERWIPWRAALAYAPALLRAFWARARLSPTLPSLKRTGVAEILYALWFAAWLSAALRQGPAL